MANKNLTHDRKRSTKGRYLPLPLAVTDSDDFRGLSGNEVKILIMIGSQFSGSNNGDLQATFTLASQWGIGSQQTLSNSLKKLLAVNLIRKTREGIFLNPGGRCALYAITWEALDDCRGKHDFQPTVTPLRAFSLERKITKPSTKSVAKRYKK